MYLYGRRKKINIVKPEKFFEILIKSIFLLNLLSILELLNKFILTHGRIVLCD